MSKQCQVAIAGATGEVGRAVLAMLEEANLPIDRVYGLASENSLEETLMYKNRALLVESLADFDFSQVQFVVLALPADVAVDVAARALAAGCRVIDHSAAHRADESVPLVMAGASARDLSGDLVACPSAPAAMLAPLLNAVDELSEVLVAQVSLLSPVSAAGRAGLRELAGQTGELLNARGIDAVVFPVQIAFNCIPLVGLPAVVSENNEESAVQGDLTRLLKSEFPVLLSAARVPVFYGQSAMITLQTQSPVDLSRLHHGLVGMGVIFADNEENQGVATPVTDSAGQDAVYMSGLRLLPAPLHGIQCWVTADNVRQGAAKHSLFVLEKWIKDLDS